MHPLLDTIEGVISGRDPRNLTEAELNAGGHYKRPIMSVIRDKCLDCCCGQQTEVRMCSAVQCALWPYRMNANPMRAEMSEAQREAAIANGKRLAEARKSNKTES